MRCSLPPLFSPRLVTIRRNVVAGSMTPWAGAAASALSPLPAAAGCGRAGTELPAAGRARARRCPHAPLRCPGRPRGEGLRGTSGDLREPWGPRPGCLPQAGRRPQARSPPLPAPAPAHVGPRMALALCCVCPPSGRFIWVGGAASLWLPGDMGAKPWQTCPGPPWPALGEAAERKMSGKLGLREHHRMVPLAWRLCTQGWEAGERRWVVGESGGENLGEAKL